MDSETANDRAVDAMAQGVELAERAAPSTPGANKVHLYGKDKSGVATIFAIDDAGTDYELSEGRPTYGAGVPGTLATGTSQTTPLIITRTLTIVKVYAYVETQPTGADILIDINKNGSTIWSTQGNRLKISTGTNLGTQTTFNTTSLVDEDIITIDVDQVGSSTAGADLTVELRTK